MLFTVLGFVTAVTAAYALTLLDNIVHGMLYNYGLQFSYDWATPYWTMLRIVQGLMIAAGIFIIVSAVYVYRKYINVKPHVTAVKSEKSEKKTVAVSPTVSPSVREMEPKASEGGGLVKCNHCKKAFAQPLRMLDFHSDRPRIINICPFCNEVIEPTSMTGKEAEKKRRFLLKPRRDDEPERKDEEEYEETVPA